MSNRQKDTRSNRQKGIIGEYQALAALSHLGSVQSIAEQNDPNHWDIYFTSRTPEFVHVSVQVKFLTSANLRLSAAHFQDWLQATVPTIPAWWDDERGTLCWADPLSALLRKGGTVPRAKVPFDRATDLHELDTSNSASVDRFLRRARSLSRLWPALRSDRSTLGLDDEFPINLVEAFQDPDVLSFLPVNRRLIEILKAHSNVRKADLSAHILRAARRGLATPDAAVVALLKNCGIPTTDHRVLGQVRDCFLDWRDGVARQKQAELGGSLWAFETILSLLEFDRPGDVKVPAFSVSRTYPLARFVKLIPTAELLGPLGRILERESRPEVLQYAAYCVGSLNLPNYSSTWEEVRELRLATHKRAAKIGPSWSYVDRQLLFTEAKLGSERAQAEYVQKLADPAVAEFEVAYHLWYYEQSRDAIRKRYEHRLDANFKEDSNVRPILALCYDHLRKHPAFNGTETPELRPELWR